VSGVFLADVWEALATGAPGMVVASAVDTIAIDQTAVQVAGTIALAVYAVQVADPTAIYYLIAVHRVAADS
jgi:hypothetical protein